jgi:cytochrome c nitrite reductase small subunit
MALSLLPALALGAVVGLATGIGGFTFFYANGASYMTDNAEACVNCHVMREQFTGWERSSHHAVAVCNDCHTPPGFVGKYTTKALNGFWHSYYFTFGGYPDPIRITARNRQIAETGCRKCHAAITEAIESPDHRADLTTSQTSCTSCHRDVGHMH